MSNGGGLLVVDIRGDEQQRRDGLIPGAIVTRRNVLEWRCDPASPWHHPLGLPVLPYAEDAVNNARRT